MSHLAFQQMRLYLNYLRYAREVKREVFPRFQALSTGIKKRARRDAGPVGKGNCLRGGRQVKPLFNFGHAAFAIRSFKKGPRKSGARLSLYLLRSIWRLAKSVRRITAEMSGSSPSVADEAAGVAAGVTARERIPGTSVSAKGA